MLSRVPGDILVALLAALVFGYAAAGEAAEAGAFDERGALRASQAAIGTDVRDLSVLDGTGRPLKLGRFLGKPLVVHFIYTGCYQVCPTTTRGLAQAVRAARDLLGNAAFEVLVIGFNAPQDTPEAMRAFARRNGVDLPGWTFGAAALDSVRELAAAFGFTYAGSPKGFDHILQTSIVDAEGRIYRQVYGDALEAPMFIGPLRELIAGDPRPVAGLGALYEKVKLLCTVYDPSSGKYKVNYGIVIEILAGLSVVLAVLGSLGLEWYRSRRQGRPRPSGS